MNCTSVLHRLNSLVQRLFLAAGEEEGQGLAEYALILSLAVIGLLIVVSVIGKQDSQMFSNVSNGFRDH